jgi:hypothetical protein
MHVLKGKVTELGPMVDVKVMPSSQRVAALKKAEMPYPQPLTVIGVLDTGAGCSCLDRTVVQQLGLDPRGIIRIHTPSTGTKYEERGTESIRRLHGYRGRVSRALGVDHSGFGLRIRERRLSCFDRSGCPGPVPL